MMDSASDKVTSLGADDEALRVVYLAAVEAQTVRWQGETVPMQRLRPALESPDRRTRERAWRVETGRWLADRPLLDELWRSLVRLRAEMAAVAGLESYPALRRRDLEYPPAVPGAGRRAQLAVEEFVTSVLVRLHERRRRQLGLRTIRPWDLLAVPSGFSAEPLFATTAEAWDAINDALHHYRTGLLDSAGESCEPLTSDADLEDVLARFGEVLAQPAISRSRRGREALAEVAATALQLLVLHGDGGAGLAVRGPTTLARSRIRHLERALLRWAFGAMIDAFEEWAYAHPRQVLEEGAAGAVWSSLWLRFLPAVDWAGLEQEEAGEWQRHAQLFIRPCESMVRIATELELLRSWTQASDADVWLEDLGVFEQSPARGGYHLAFEIHEMDLLDTARWMEDAIEGLEDNRH
jgi:oligoendopeptidase F